MSSACGLLAMRSRKLLALGAEEGIILIEVRPGDRFGYEPLHNLSAEERPVASGSARESELGLGGAPRQQKAKQSHGNCRRASR